MRPDPLPPVRVPPQPLPPVPLPAVQHPAVPPAPRPPAPVVPPLPAFGVVALPSSPPQCRLVNAKPNVTIPHGINLRIVLCLLPQGIKLPMAHTATAPLQIMLAAGRRKKSGNCRGHPRDVRWVD